MNTDTITTLSISSLWICVFLWLTNVVSAKGRSGSLGYFIFFVSFVCFVVLTIEEPRNTRKARKPSARCDSPGTGNHVTPNHAIHRPVLARHARYRWDDLRKQHQLVFPEGVLVLNETGAAIVRCCDGRTAQELISELKRQFPVADPAGDVHAFFDRLSKKGLVRDAAES